MENKSFTTAVGCHPYKLLCLWRIRKKFTKVLSHWTERKFVHLSPCTSHSSPSTTHQAPQLLTQSLCSLLRSHCYSSRPPTMDLRPSTVHWNPSTVYSNPSAIHQATLLNTQAVLLFIKTIYSCGECTTTKLRLICEYHFLKTRHKMSEDLFTKYIDYSPLDEVLYLTKAAQ